MCVCVCAFRRCGGQRWWLGQGRWKDRRTDGRKVNRRKAELRGGWNGECTKGVDGRRDEWMEGMKVDKKKEGAEESRE